MNSKSFSAWTESSVPMDNTLLFMELMVADNVSSPVAVPQMIMFIKHVKDWQCACGRALCTVSIEEVDGAIASLLAIEHTIKSVRPDRGIVSGTYTSHFTVPM